MYFIRYGTIMLGIVCLAGGVLMFRSAWRQRRQARQLEKKKTE
ncbi:hypothetical protein ACYX78_03240 [Advenella incenata]